MLHSFQAFRVGLLLIVFRSCSALQLDRTQFFQLGGAYWIAAATNKVEIACQNDNLLPEQAVPGAYSQACMALPERSMALKNGQMIKVRQEASGSGRTGMAVWNSGLLLLRLVQALDIPKKSLLELGCGTGLVSIAAAKLGAMEVVATDGNPEIVTLAQSNIESNGCESIAKAQLLQWGLLDAMDFSDSADLILGSDLTYNSGTWRVLAETMFTIVKPNGHILYLSCGHEGFNVNAEFEGFLSVAKEVGLIPVDEIDGINVSKLLPKLVTPSEAKQLESSGGVRVVVLQRKQVVKKG